MDAKPVWIMCLVLLAGCSTPRQPLPPQAIIGKQCIEEAIRIQKEMNERSKTPPPEGQPWFEVREGHAPIFVTAPHATRPFRKGRYRYSDGGGTASLAVMVHQIDGATAMYTIYESPSDPNFYNDNAFKTALKELIERKKPVLLLDIHGSDAYRPYDVDLGTLDGKSLLGDESIERDLLRALRSEGVLNISSNYLFTGRKQETITKFASDLGVPAMQLEINFTRIDPAHGDLYAHRFSQLLQAIARFVELRKQMIPGYFEDGRPPVERCIQKSPSD